MMIIIILHQGEHEDDEDVDDVQILIWVWEGLVIKFTIILRENKALLIFWSHETFNINSLGATVIFNTALFSVNIYAASI